VHVADWRASDVHGGAVLGRTVLARIKENL
jgi:hypothetical protein